MEEKSEDNYNYVQGKYLARAPPGEEIVISGLAGTFPRSHDVYEYQNNLFNKVDMIQQNMRWTHNHPEIPPRGGCIPVPDKYDAGFFGVHQIQAESQDSLCRILLEKSIEAIFDAGLNPEDVAGTNTGVYVGSCFSESQLSVLNNYFGTLAKYGFSGVVRYAYANRISYFLKLKGPSFVADTACSSSLFALENAFRDIRLGVVDAAIVAGSNMCLHPYTTLQFARLGVLSTDGLCKVFDQNGDGYVRSEAIGVIFLQKAKVAKRRYAELTYIKTNCDGFKEAGITHPSGQAQRELMSDCYQESGLSPASLSFLEAHGTGTFVGDPEECAGIDEVLATHRTDSLLMGSVKSNIGHTEPASGICSIAKCIIGFETDYIPPNINYVTPRENIHGIIEGRLEVVTEKKRFKDNRKIIGVNSFGFGGGNCHIILRGNLKEKINNGLPEDNIPRLVCFSGRTEESMITLLDELKSNTVDAENVRLLHNVFRKDIPNHTYRGFSILSKNGELYRFYKNCSKKTLSLFFAFGEIKNWYDIGRSLMPISIFSETIEKAQNILLPKGINISKQMFETTEGTLSNHVLGSVLVQIGLVHILKALELQPTRSFSCSVGELVAAYFEGDLTFQQIIECAVVVNNIVNKVVNISQSNKEAVIISHLNNDSIGHTLRSICEYPEYVTYKKELLSNLSNLFGKSKINNRSIDCYLHSMTRAAPDKLSLINKNSILITIGDVTIMDENVENIVFPLVGSEDCVILEKFLETLGQIYINGYNPQLAKIYPDVSFPVSRGTKMISPFIRWKHDRSYFLPYYGIDNIYLSKVRSRTVFISLQDKEWLFVKGHVIDGRNLFPATAYLYLAWETLAHLENVQIGFRDAVFENVKFMRATTVPKRGKIVFIVTLKKFGHFEIIEGGSAVVSGQIICKAHENITFNRISENFDDSLNLISKDVYKEMRLRGYNYFGDFRSIKEFNINRFSGMIKWTGHWVSFLDNLLQCKIFTTDTRLLYVPTYISHVSIPATSFLEWMNTISIHSDNDDNKNEEKDILLPARINKHTGDIRCGNILIRGLIASSIPRRKDLNIPVLESYEFVPNITELKLEESIRVNMQIFLEYVSSKSAKCIEIIDDFTKDDSLVITLIQAAFEDLPIIKAVPKILSKRKFDDLSESIPVEDRDLSSETDVNLVIGSSLLTRPEILTAANGCLKENGFVISREDLNSYSPNTVVSDFVIFTVHTTPTEIIVFLKKQSKLKQLLPINVNSSEDLLWIEPLKEVIKTKSSDNVLLYSQGDQANGVLGLVNCLRREPESQYIRCLLILDDAEEFDIQKPFYKEQLDKNMAMNIWKNNAWGSYRHLTLKNIKTVKSQHCFVKQTVRGDLSSLRWCESTLRNDMITPPERKLVHVHYASLNFRDVMIASGKINADVITQDRIEQENVIGFEFAGYTREGDKVMGLASNGALSSLILTDEYLMFRVPDSISLQEAATIPVVYCTVIYGLLMKGQLEEGESILIHSGTGGIGQAAIRMALHYNCTIFTTVGSTEKKEFLLQTFPQIKPEHIGCSRDTSFEKMVKKYTHGHGVNLVLNSLSEEKLMASIRCLARQGRFIEIGKFDLVSNTELNLLLLEKEASFHGVMLDHMFEAPPSEKKKLCDVLVNNFRNFIRPLPATVFGYNQVEEAFRHLTTGKHMGKVLVRVRDTETIPSEVPEMFEGMRRYYCYPEKSYIIIGGLGGFGLELADWLVLRGAKKLVLTSRKGISTGYQKMRISTWETYGVIVKISKEDINTVEGCQTLLKDSNKLGKVNSIFNLAVVLADSVFENQTENTFRTSLGPKANATKYLDEVSRTICPDLKEFVVFSSVSCGRGNRGQSNYGMANSIMERICENRKKEGYPALAIQWGAVGDVGLVAEMQEEHFQLEIGGTLQQNISNCLNVLDNFLNQKDVAIVSSMVVAQKRGGLGSCDNVVDTVINILGLRDPKTVSHHATLPELGMDSMTGVEIKQTLERDFEIFLTPKDMKTMTLAKLKKIHEDKTLAETSEEQTNIFNLILKGIGNEEESKLLEIKFKSKLADEDSGPTIILFPGADGFANRFVNLAENLQARVVGVQYWHTLQYKSVQEISVLLLPVIEKYVKQNEPFHLVGYSFGCLVAAEMTYLLESKGYLGNLIFIDGAHLLMTKMFSFYKQDSLNLFQTEFATQLIATLYSTELATQNQEKLLKCESWEERLKVAEEIIKTVTSSPETVAYHMLIANNTYQRTALVGIYTPSFEKLKSPITLLKPSIPVFSDIANDYDLSKISDSDVEVLVFEGNHATIIDNELVAQKINSLIQSTTS